MDDGVPSIHHASDGDRRDVVTLPHTALSPAAGWWPFGPADLQLWVGPRAVVAQRGRRGRWRIAEPARARSLLIEHADTVPPDLDRALTELTARVPLGTPIEEAVSAFRDVLAGYLQVDEPASSTTLFLRPGLPALEITAGKYRDLESLRWVRGDESLALLADRELASEGLLDDTLVIPITPSQRRTTRRAVVVMSGSLVGVPLAVAPLLLLDAVSWLIGVALGWTAMIVLAPGVLRHWGRASGEQVLRLDPWRLWLPRDLGSVSIDRSTVSATLARRSAFGVATTGTAGRAPAVRNPAMVYLTLRAPELDVTVGCESEPPADRPIAQVPPGWTATPFATVSASALWRLADRLGARSR